MPIQATSGGAPSQTWLNCVSRTQPGESVSRLDASHGPGLWQTLLLVSLYHLAKQQEQQPSSSGITPNQQRNPTHTPTGTLPQTRPRGSCRQHSSDKQQPPPHQQHSQHRRHQPPTTTPPAAAALQQQSATTSCLTFWRQATRLTAVACSSGRLRAHTGSTACLIHPFLSTWSSGRKQQQTKRPGKQRSK